MTATDAPTGEEAIPARRASRNLSLLTRLETGRRNRRLADAAILIAGVVVTGLTAVIARSSPTDDADVASALVTVLGWAAAFWRTAFVALLVLSVAILVDVILRRRWDLARDAALALLVVAIVGAALGRAVESDWFPIEG